MAGEKRNFKIVEINGKAMEMGLYKSSSPSGAARKAFTQLCSKMSKSKDRCDFVFSIKETTNGSAKKVYGPYVGEKVKLKKPIELEGRTITHKAIVHKEKSVKK